MDQISFEVAVVGGRYRSGIPWHELRPGQICRIVHDPNGQTTGTRHSDPNALAVFDFQDRQIGYLPRDRAAILGPLVRDNLIDIQAKIIWVAGADNVHLSCTLSEKLECPPGS